MLIQPNVCIQLSKWILSGTSAQLGYSVPFTLTLTDTGKYRAEDEKSGITESITQKKQYMRNIVNT